jgi:glycosyltransferase involved in cell wall biosynthesis
MRPAVSIIVPAFNEAGNLKAAVDGMQYAAVRAGFDRYEIIVVDDGSTDGTGHLADRLAASDQAVRVIHHPTNQGLRAAYESGLAAAQYDRVTWVPGDGEMATESIAEILRAIPSGGSEYLVIPFHGTPERRPWLRRLLTWGSTTQLNWLLWHDLRYFQGTVVYPTDLARRIPRTEPGFFCMAEMLAWALEDGYAYVEVPLAHVERQYGESKAVGWSKVWAAQKLIVKLWWRITTHRMTARAHKTLAEA